jgi:hypothetical protein
MIWLYTVDLGQWTVSSTNVNGAEIAALFKCEENR